MVNRTVLERIDAFHVDAVHNPIGAQERQDGVRAYVSAVPSRGGGSYKGLHVVFSDLHRKHCIMCRDTFE